MSWTKRQLIEQSLAKIGLSASNYDADPEDMQSALRELDVMMSEWEDKGIKIDWPFAVSPELSELDTETEAPTHLVAAIYFNLAQRIAIDFGRAVPPRVDALAKKNFDRALGKYNPIKPMVRGRRLAGAGNRRGYCGRRALLPADDIEASGDE